MLTRFFKEIAYFPMGTEEITRENHALMREFHAPFIFDFARRRAEFAQGPGDETFQRQRQPRARRGDSGAEIKKLKAVSQEPAERGL
jgi:hypothetical protein